MLDRKFILQNAQLVAENSAKRGVSVDVDAICRLEAERMDALKQAEELNRQANEVSKRIKSAKDNDERQELIAKGRSLREQKDAAGAEQDRLEGEINELQTILPNMTHPDVPEGG
ncbi:MAG: serine--tRNA ligase, partial [Rhodopirellula bahusiensis]